MHDIPVPEIFGYSTTSENAAGTEYIFMQFVRDMNLSDIWFEMPKKARVNFTIKLVDLERRLFSLQFPASGSLYCAEDLPSGTDIVNIPIANSSYAGRFCIGPETILGL